MEALASKVKITQDMVGQSAYILTEPEKYQVSGFGELIYIIFKPNIDARSLEQLNLYWAGNGVIAEDNALNEDWNTKDKVDRQVKWGVRFIKGDSVVHLTAPDGSERLYFELDSISFTKANAYRANQFFKQAFPKQAEFHNCSEEEFIALVKSKMKMKRICCKCGDTDRIEKHHKFSDSNYNRQLYPDFIDHPDNLQYLCYNHHHNQSLDKWTELEFCRHFKIKPRSKELLQRVAEGKIKQFWKEEDAA